ELRPDEHREPTLEPAAKPRAIVPPRADEREEHEPPGLVLRDPPVFRREARREAPQHVGGEPVRGDRNLKGQLRAGLAEETRGGDTDHPEEDEDAESHERPLRHPVSDSNTLTGKAKLAYTPVMSPLALESSLR